MNWGLFFTAMGQWLQARLGERSTYLGLVSLASSLGVVLSPEYAQAICAIAAAIVGALLIATKDAISLGSSTKTEVGAGSDEK